MLPVVLLALCAAPAALLAATTASVPALPSSSVQVHYNETSTSTTTTPATETVDDCGCVCGLSRRTRIVGGEEAKEAEFPWLAALARRGKFYCGGALITRKHVLTAAHCMYSMSPKDITVTMGAHNRSSSRWAPGRVERKLSKVSVHERFDVSNFNNDIAILELDKEVDIDTEAGLTRTVCLPAGERDYAGLTGTVTGWGRVGERKPTSDVLRKVEVPLMAQEDCHKSGYPSGRITDKMVCAGLPKGLKDACQGDSGGPLVLGSESGPSSEVIGIVSWGRGCARPNFPGVYTRVHKFLPWIHEKLGDTCTCRPAA
ncbi:trypsin-like [Thrips palmi]|uniref:Trypsin-like n=1 Tax=Thrips palmi TaxID=161013 RepID=A0A6P8ZN59_THRPL|nr:trypsin-like [Thrips palmi]